MKKVFSLSILFCFFLLPVLSGSFAVGAKKKKKDQQPPAPTFDLTEIDLFSLDPEVNTNQIRIMGIGLNTPLKAVLKQFNIPRSSIIKFKKKGKPGWLWIKPGFKIRIQDKRIDALIIQSLFRQHLAGKVANVFDYVESDIKLRLFVKKNFRKPDRFDNIYINELQWDAMLYKQGFEIARRFDTYHGYALFISISRPKDW